MPPSPSLQARRALITGVAATIATACTARAPIVPPPIVPPPMATALPDTWPGADWERITPEAAGRDSGALAAAQDYAGVISTASFAVVHQAGYLWPDLGNSSPSRTSNPPHITAT